MAWTRYTIRKIIYYLLSITLISSKNKYFQCDQINNAACAIAKQVSKEKDTITVGGIAMTDIYQSTHNKEKTIAELKIATKALIENDIDMIICEVET